VPNSDVSEDAGDYSNAILETFVVSGTLAR